MPGSLTDIHSYVGGCFVFLIGSLAVQAGLKLAMLQRMIPNSRSSCLYFPGARFTGMCHHILFMQCWGWNHIPSPSSYSLLRVAHSGTKKMALWQACCLEYLSIVTPVTKLVFHENGKMSLIKFPFDKRISIAYWK